MPGTTQERIWEGVDNKGRNRGTMVQGVKPEKGKAIIDLLKDVNKILNGFIPVLERFSKESGVDSNPKDELQVADDGVLLDEKEMKAIVDDFYNDGDRRS